MKNEVLNAIVDAIKEKPVEDPRVPKRAEELATAEEITAVVHEANPDLTAFDLAEREYAVYEAKVNRNGNNGIRVALARMAAAFPEIDQKYFAYGSFPEPIVGLIAQGLDRIAREKMSAVMAPHVEPLNKLWAEIAAILESAADAQIESEHRAFTIVESERESKARAFFEAGARQRFLKGHDDHKFNFVAKVFSPSSLPERLKATAARLRQFTFQPKWGFRPSSAPIHGLLSAALLSHPGGK